MANDAFNCFEKSEDVSVNRKARSEINFSQFIKSGEEEVAFESSIPDDGGLHSNSFSNYDLVDFETSLKKLSSKLDPKTRKIIKLVYFDDYSIKDAAEQVGLTGWAASMRLKKLALRGPFKAIFEQDLLQSLSDEISGLD
jgi:DNA-directed RNA polymerase specialized sigma subunit